MGVSAAGIWMCVGVRQQQPTHPAVIAMGGCLTLNFTSQISLSKLILAAHCLQTWAGPPSWQQLKPLTQGTQVLAPGPLLFNLLFAALAALQPTVIHE